MSDDSLKSVSVIIPAKNEAGGLSIVLPKLKSISQVSEVIVVDDGSDDDTVAVCNEYGVRVISHPYSKGNGAAIKTGVRAATSEIAVCMDADDQHKPEDIPRLIDKLGEGFDMVVGYRERESQADVGRLFANTFYNKFSSWMVGHKIKDLTSGFRIFKVEKFREFLYLLPNGFSYPTTSTMAFFRAGYSVGYMPIIAQKRIGKSHINWKKDGVRFLLIIFKIGTLYSPLKLFTPISIVFLLLGLLNYAYTYITAGQFTNMSALMFSTSMLIFLMGLISEQVASLIYSKKT